VHKASLQVETSGRGLYEITGDLERIVAESKIDDGICVVFLRHTSASLLIQENADPSVQQDFLAFFARLVPDGDSLFTHRAEGPDDMAAHLRCALTHTSEVVPVGDGALCLGTWQGLYLFEHRIQPHRRRVEIRVFGES